MDTNSFSLLPGEIIHNICELLPKQDLYRLRCTNKRFSSLVAKHVFAEIDGYSTQESLNALLMIARSPNISSLVRELHYYSFELEDIDRMPIYTSYPNSQAYQSISQEQRAFLATGRHFDLLVHLFQDLSELKTLHFSCNSVPARILRRQDAPMFHHEDTPPGVHLEIAERTFGFQCFEILQAIATAKPAALETLILNHFDWVEAGGTPTPWHSLKPLRGLKRLEVFTPARFFIKHQTLELSDVVPVCNSIGAYSSKMVHLRTISIGVAEPLPSDDEEVATLYYQAPFLSSLILPTSTFIHLCTLRLQNIKCEKDELTDLLKRHQESLRELFLSDLFLRTTSCISLLREMKALSSRLTTVQVRGIIEGKGSPYEDWPALHQRQRWNLGCGDLTAPSELQAQVSLYLEHGGQHYSGSGCPLRDDNCMILDLFNPHH